MTHDEHHDQPHDQPNDANGDDFEFEIDPLDITPYQPDAASASDKPEPVQEPEDVGPETVVPRIPVPPAADESLPAAPTPPRVPVSPTADDVPPADGVPAVPMSETFAGDVFGAPSAERDTTRDTGRDAGRDIFSSPPPPPPPPPPPAVSDDEFDFLLKPKGKPKRKRKHDADYDPAYARSFTWFEAWMQAISQPRPDAYEELIARSAGVNAACDELDRDHIYHLVDFECVCLVRDWYVVC